MAAAAPRPGSLRALPSGGNADPVVRSISPFSRFCNSIQDSGHLLERLPEAPITGLRGSAGYPKLLFLGVRDLSYLHLERLKG
jgi:hypothetical protein